MNILTALIVLSIILLAIYVKKAYIYKEKVVPEPGSLFIIIPDAVNGYGMDIITNIAEKEDYHVLGIVRTLADAEFLRSSGLGKLDASVWTKADISGGIVKNEMPVVASSSLVNEYAAMNITVSGIVAVLTPHHFYDKNNQSEMSGFEFSVETITEVLMSLILIQEMLMNKFSKTECKEKPMRIVLVAPYIPHALYSIPHSLNTTEMAELVVIRALDAAVAESRRQFSKLGFSVSLVYSPSRYAPNETLLQVNL